MKATISLDSIWSFLQSFSLSNRNKQWLADKLLEDIKMDKVVKTKEEMDNERFASLAGCWANDAEMEDMEDVIRHSRMSGGTRKILRLDGEGYLD